MDTSYIILLIGLITIVCIIFYNKLNNEMIYVRSDIDNELYLVRNTKDKQKAANLLARINANIRAITIYMNDKLENQKPLTDRYAEFSPYILQLKDKIKNVIVKESASNSIYTSYTVNKGEQIIFCIRSKALTSVLESSNIHDFNIIMYVALHEISHVACPEFGHTPLFKNIFHFFCEEAIGMGIYEKVDYGAHPKEYCGMKINDSII